MLLRSNVKAKHFAISVPSHDCSHDFWPVLMQVLFLADTLTLPSRVDRPLTTSTLLLSAFRIMKTSILPQHPKMTCAWKCNTSDDYAQFKTDTEEEFTEDLKQSEYTFVDLGKAHLSMFFGDLEIAKDIAKDPLHCGDDAYYFGGEEGKKDKVNDCVQKHYDELTKAKTSRHTPEKKRKRDE